MECAILKNHDQIGIQVPEVLLPREGIDLGKWAVIACDQFTSEPEYWRKVEAEVGAAPSTLNLVLPEIYLNQPGKDARIETIQQTMRQYLAEGLLVPHQGMVHVEREVDGHKRHGIVLALDLERYDYSRGSSSLIRATEGTIVDRLPPRMAIREGAALEVPHILVLIDDPGRTVIEPLRKASLPRAPLYDFDLMLGSGRLTGWAIGAEEEARIVKALGRLAQPEAFAARYKLENQAPVLLYAMGDGNHSLATAKAVWEKLKPGVGPDHPARYALVEIENVHDEGLAFHPIHRVLFDVKGELPEALRGEFGAGVDTMPVGDPESMADRVDRAIGQSQVIGLVEGSGEPAYKIVEFRQPTSSLAVGTLQAFLDKFMEQRGAERMDYVHGTSALLTLASKPGNVGFYLPKPEKSSLFRTVVVDGALPRKTFSMGEAREKRFYMEARRIS
jgi:hypothetical protein